MQKAKLDGADGEAKGLCTLVGLSLFRRPDLLAFAADSAPGTGIGSGAFGYLRLSVSRPLLRRLGGEDRPRKPTGEDSLIAGSDGREW